MAVALLGIEVPKRYMENMELQFQILPSKRYRWKRLFLNFRTEQIDSEPNETKVEKYGSDRSGGGL